jgi:hypothetical protein
LSRYEPDGFLKAHGEYIQYSMEDFDRKWEALRKKPDTGPVHYLILIEQISFCRCCSRPYEKKCSFREPLP